MSNVTNKDKCYNSCCPRLGSSSRRLRIDFIIYYAVVILVMGLITSLTAIFRSKKSRRDDLTSLQEAPPSLDSTHDTPVASQGYSNKGCTVQQKRKEGKEHEEQRDSVGELPKVYL